MIVRLRIEENNCVSEKKVQSHSMESIIDAMKGQKNNNSKKMKHNGQGPNQGA